MGAIYKLGSKFAGLVAWCTQQATTTSTATSDKPAVIKENYYDSTTGSWYRVWSDGWIEQGGTAHIYANAVSATITLLKPFNEEKYVVVGGKNTGDTARVGLNIHRGTTTRFYTGVSFENPLERDIYWYACGY